MPAFLRIAPHKGLQSLSEGEKPTALDKYQEALTKLIPAEVVALYLGGKNAIQAYFGAAAAPADAPTEGIWWVGWFLACLAGLVAFRRWATSAKSLGVPPEWPAILLSATSFVVWVYAFGDAFRIAFKIWHPLLATLLVLGWTFAVPLIHRAVSKDTEPS